MALMKPGPLVSQVSGRVGGTIFSHNRGGMYIRNGTKPHVVSSDAAETAKSLMSICSRLWGALDEPERDAWRSYCVEKPSINRLGESRTLAGHQAFNQINARILWAGGSAIDLPPAGGPPDPVSLTSLTLDASDEKAELVFTPTPVPASTSMWIWACVVSSPGLSYFANRYRLVARVAPAQASPVDFGADLITRFGSLQAGQIVHCRVQNVSRLTGLQSGYSAIMGVVAG